MVILRTGNLAHDQYIIEECINSVLIIRYFLFPKFLWSLRRAYSLLRQTAVRELVVQALVCPSLGLSILANAETRKCSQCP